MDEILIEDKKYVSSKRAAKETGYAKDYIGQLCREGRVPARLVGRSWYVLESAIQDHRFGDVQGENEVIEASSELIHLTREAPRYQVSTDEILPQITHREEKEIQESTQIGPSQELHNSWRAWFDIISQRDKAVSETVAMTHENGSLQEIEAHQTEEKEVQIPIQTIYELPPEDLLPGKTQEDDEKIEEQPRPTVILHRKGRRRIIRFSGYIVAIIAAALSILNSGYFDKAIVSLSNPLINSIAGVGAYIR